MNPQTMSESSTSNPNAGSSPLAAEMVGDPIRSLLTTAIDRVDDLESEVRTFAKQHPFLAIAGATVVSVALHSFMRMKDQSREHALNGKEASQAPSTREIIDVGISS